MASKKGLKTTHFNLDNVVADMNKVKTLEATPETSGTENHNAEKSTKINLENEPVKTNKKVLVNFRINETLLNEVKAYCDENYMTLTAGIIRALREMIRGKK